ncbi:MAG: anti-sigma factor family protein [Syntrophomonadaceae bacterium]|jgi:hypothetical protein
MNCQQLDKLIYDYVDGRLTPETEIAIEKHLNECQFCQHNVKLTEIENTVLIELDCPVPVPDITSNVMSNIKAMNSTGKAEKRNWGWCRLPNFAIAAVLILLLASTGYFLNSNKFDTEPASQIAHHGSTTTNDVREIAEPKALKSTPVPQTSPSPQHDQDISRATINHQPKDASLQSAARVQANSVEVPETIPENEDYKTTPPVDTISALQFSQKTGAADLRVQPVNVPSGYRLTDTSSENGVTTFSYSDDSKTKNFKISITEVQTHRITAADGYGQPAASNQTEYKVKQTSPASWQVNISGYTYTIVLTSNLSPEENQLLKETIGFEEIL